MTGRHAPITAAGRRLLGLLAACVVFLGCAPTDRAAATSPPGRRDAVVGRLAAAPGVPGDPAEGRRLFLSTGCAGCHSADNMAAATGVAGPNLSNVVLRPTLAGESIPMTPATVARFLEDPNQVKPGTTMPDVGLTADEARQITAFLYSQPYNPAR